MPVSRKRGRADWAREREGGRYGDLRFCMIPNNGICLRIKFVLRWGPIVDFASSDTCAMGWNLDPTSRDV